MFLNADWKKRSIRAVQRAQKMLLNFGPETDNPCVNCQRYKIMKETKSYLTLEEIEEYKK